jgi:hypothetical protein
MQDAALGSYSMTSLSRKGKNTSPPPKLTALDRRKGKTFDAKGVKTVRQYLE